MENQESGNRAANAYQLAVDLMLLHRQPWLI